LEPLAGRLVTSTLCNLFRSLRLCIESPRLDHTSDLLKSVTINRRLAFQ
jgi:hypothetical protein